jgi:NADH-ubiquinone oxidoreductase subunit b14.5b (NDUFC2)
MADWAIKIFEDDPNREKPFLTQWWPTFGSALFGFGAICFMNLGTRKPILAGLF